jgi:hypothetical protein
MLRDQFPEFPVAFFGSADVDRDFAELIRVLAASV